MERPSRICQLVVCLWIVSSVIPAFSQESYNFERMWGSPGTGDGQFKNPSGVAVDSSGNVYVADSGNARIQKFDTNGTFITKWGSPGNSYFAGSVAVDLSGNVYVVSNEYTIEKFNSSGNFITEWHMPLGNMLCLEGIAADSSGNVFATTYYCCFISVCPIPDDKTSVWKFDSNGNLITKWGDWGTEDGQFNGPGGIAVDSSGNVYVADKSNLRIQKFDSNGNFITKWAFTPDYNSPNGVAVDRSGNVYVLLSQPGPPFVATFPPENPRVEKYDPNGNFITRWGSHGEEEGQFSYPNGMAVDLSGVVYVADTYNHRIQKFSLTLPPIDLKSPSVNEHFNACSSLSPPVFSWNVSDTFNSYVVQFSPDETFTMISFEFVVEHPTTEFSIPSDTWEDITMIPGTSGGAIYWRVIGIRAGGTTETSNKRPFQIVSQVVGNSNIYPTGKRSKPTLTWQNNCNTKFKVVFGSDSSFTKKVSFTFSIKDPTVVDFSKMLNPGQWAGVKRLVKNKSGSTVYWEVYSYDELGRGAKTDVMSFTLTD